MPLYIGDYLSDTMHLTTEQHGAYILLIMAYWKNGGPLPADDAMLAATCRLSGDAWSIAKAVLIRFFTVSDDGMTWVHERIDRELSGAAENKQRRIVRAKNAAEARWGNDAKSNATSMRQAMLDECPSPSPSPIKIKSSCNQQADDGHRFRFAEIQEAYNRICSPTLPKCMSATEERKRKARRMVDLEFNGKRPFREHGLPMWESYFRDCLTNKHWIGENDRGWRADFDFVTNPKNAIKLLERICG